MEDKLSDALFHEIKSFAAEIIMEMDERQTKKVPHCSLEQWGTEILSTINR